jgi:hypothetical protein
MYCSDSSDFFQLFTLNSIQKLQIKKFVSNGNELKNAYAGKGCFESIYAMLRFTGMSAKYSDLPLGAARFGQVVFLFRAFEPTCDF